MYAGPMEPLPPAVLPRSPAALVAFIQGRAIEIVTALLSRGSVVSVPADTVSSPPPYSGPDAELIRLQQDVLRLGLEALRSKSVNSQAPK